MIFDEVKIMENDAHEDFRGELWTLWKKDDNFVGGIKFNHDKVSISRKNVFRGIHGDNRSWKLISCLSGQIILIVVDNREHSPNYLKWDSIILSSKNRRSVLVPPMFGNGHYVLSDEATFFYKWAYTGSYPDVKDQFTLKWNDPRLKIYWPTTPILSERDK
jgi:dTDP-4-dehydrorhamnose 3,5-epimerase